MFKFRKKLWSNKICQSLYVKIIFCLMSWLIFIITEILLKYYLK